MENNNGNRNIDIDSLFEFDNVTVVNDELVNNEVEVRNNRMTSVIGKFASALTSRLIQVHLSSAKTNDQHISNTESWSDAENLWFNVDKIGDLSDEARALAIKGLSLHEIGHILYTPRSSSNLVKWVTNNKYVFAFNALEDQRLELFLATKYSNVKYWFTASVTEFLLSNSAEIPYAYATMHGRSYLPVELRNLLRDAFINQDIVAELAQIIDDYTVLNLSNSADIPVAMKLIERYHKLLKLDESTPEIPRYKDHGTCGHPTFKSSEKSKTTNKAGQDAVIKKILKQRNQQSNSTDGEQEPEGESESGSDSQCPTVPVPVKPGDGDGDSDGNNKTDTNNNNDSKTNQAGNGDKSTTVDKVLESAQKHYNNSKDILRNDISDMIQQFNGEEQLNSKHIAKPLPSRVYGTSPVAPDVVDQVKSFTNQLHLIKADYDPGWLRKVDVGKLNVQRYATGVDADECFDQWDNGREDVTDIEAVILLDTSSSMNWTRASAFDSTWAIKRSLDKVEASTTVLTFDNEARVLYSSDERAKAQKKVSQDSGGTEPLYALKYAKYLLANSQRAIKLLIVITDGAWYDGGSSDKIVQELRRAGVITALGFIDEDGRYTEEQRQALGLTDKRKLTIDGHGAEIVVRLDNGAGLLKLAKAIVKLGVKRNLVK